MKSKIKNYTSSATTARSVQHIEERLVMNGAKDILKTYEGGRLSGIAFIVDAGGTDMPFRLPARVKNVENALKGSVKRPHRGTMERIEQQAERTAWKLLSDWVDVQMSLIELDQAKFMEVFLPYVYDHASRKTYFEVVEERGFSNLLTYSGGKGE